MNLDEIQKLWEEDSKIDPDNLQVSEFSTSCKYYDIYNKTLLLRKKTSEDLQC